MPNPFLYELFNAARRRLGLPIGMEEYFLLLRALRMGKGVVGREALLQLCETLWVKNERQRQVFRQYFQEQIRDDLRAATAILEALEATSPPPGKEPDKPPEVKPDAPDPEIKEQKNAEADKEKEPERVESEVEKPKPAQDAEMMLSMEEGEEEIALTEAEEDKDPSILSHKYVFTDTYLPLNDRQLKQNWRFLRSQSRAGLSEEIDLEATIQRVAKEGYLQDFVYLPDHRNKIRLVLMIDQQGSMIAFRKLAAKIIDTAIEGGRQQETQTLYFRNTPGDLLFTRPDRTQALTRKKLLSNWSKKYTYVLIFSDGGAARGTLNSDRLDAIWDFLDLLKIHTRHVVWLNPVPRHRWPGATAEHIADIVPMYQATPQGFRKAIQVLRGKS